MTDANIEGAARKQASLQKLIKLKPPFRHVRRSGYLAFLPDEYRVLANHHENWFESPLRILENGVPLKLPYADHLSIQYAGGGAYNHWDSYIEFSASDSSDPNTNGRSYELARIPEPPDANSPMLHRAHVILSTSCNLWCRICRDKPFMSEFMSMHLFDKIAEEILPVAELRLDGGGEILLNRDLPKLLGKLASLNQPFFTSTNGMLLSPEKARLLAESSLHHIQISLDSPQKETLEWIRRGANFERIIAGVKHLVQARKEAGRPFLITFHAAVMRENVRQLPDLVRLAHELGVEGVTACHLFAMPCTEPDSSCFWNQQEYDDMRENAIETARLLDSFFYGPAPFAGSGMNSAGSDYCIYPASGAYINPDGGVAPCCIAQDAILGNLARQSFEDIWNSEPYQRLRETYRTKNPSVPDCARCRNNSPRDNWRAYFAPVHWQRVRERLASSEKRENA